MVTGLDVCVCVALALLIACFTSAPSDSSTPGGPGSAAVLTFCNVYSPPPSDPVPPVGHPYPASTSCSCYTMLKSLEIRCVNKVDL